MAGGSLEQGRSVTSKVIGLLETFESVPGSLSLTEISALSGIPASTTRRLVGELAASGLLEHTTGGRYQVGIRLWELAQKAGRHLREAARPKIQDLAAMTNQSVMISVRQGRDSLVIERAHGDRQPAKTSKVGSRLPLHTSAAGKVLLAFEAEWIRRSYLAEPLQRLTQDTHVDRAGLERELETTAQSGYAQSLHEVRVGASAIAVPMFHSGQIAAAVSLVTHSSRNSQLKGYLPALRATSAAVEGATRHLSRGVLLGISQDLTSAEV